MLLAINYCTYFGGTLEGEGPLYCFKVKAFFCHFYSNNDIFPFLSTLNVSQH